MSRPVPECHRWQGVLAIHAGSGSWEVAGAVHDTSCIGSRCSAFLLVPSPTDPNLRQGVCGLIPGAVPWPDPSPPEVTNADR